MRERTSYSLSAMQPFLASRCSVHETFFPSCLNSLFGPGESVRATYNVSILAARSEKIADNDFL